MGYEARLSPRILAVTFLLHSACVVNEMLTTKVTRQASCLKQNAMSRERRSWVLWCMRVGGELRILRWCTRFSWKIGPALLSLGAVIWDWRINPKVLCSRDEGRREVHGKLNVSCTQRNQVVISGQRGALPREDTSIALSFHSLLLRTACSDLHACTEYGVRVPVSASGGSQNEQTWVWQVTSVVYLQG